jgi:hypothetical protein
MRIIQFIATFFIGIIFGIIYTCTFNAHTEPVDPPKPQIEYVYVEQEPEVVTEYVYLYRDETEYRNHTEQEEWYYKDLGMREIEGGDVNDFLWVFYTMECRCEAFGTSVEEEWGGSAFQTSMFRSGIEPNENCLKAYEIFREGWTPKPLYFRAGHYHNFGNPLCQVGPHYFSNK